MKTNILFIISVILGTLKLNAQLNDSTQRVIAIETVMAQQLCLGALNPVNIAVSGVSSDKLDVSIDNGTLTGRNGHYFIRPDKATICNITVIADGKIINRNSIRVKAITAPIVVQLSGKTGGEISKEEIFMFQSLKAFFTNTEFDLPLWVVAFRITIVKDGYLKQLNKTGNALNPEMIELIKNASPDSPLFIDEIKISGSDGVNRDANPLSFKLK